VKLVSVLRKGPLAGRRELRNSWNEEGNFEEPRNSGELLGVGGGAVRRAFKYTEEMAAARTVHMAGRALWLALRYQTDHHHRLHHGPR
jgi:hypothetical protein